MAPEQLKCCQTEELNFQFVLILMNLNSHIQQMAILYPDQPRTLLAPSGTLLDL